MEQNEYQEDQYNGCQQETKYTHNKYCHRWTTDRTSNIIYVFGSLITEDGRYEKEILKENNNNDSTDYIHQYENTTIVPWHKPEDQIDSNKMLYLAEIILWSGEMDNNKITVVQT